jgi:hypothetical protein
MPNFLIGTYKVNKKIGTIMKLCTIVNAFLLISLLYIFREKILMNNLELSNYVTIVVIVPESHADVMRETLGRAGAGKVGNYSFGSFSVKGISRFKPEDNARPFIGTQHVLETVIEERIETVCSRDILEHVIAEIKKAHPYEETIIDIIPIYKIGHKTPGINSF